jgi:hypothetical protein
MHRPELVLFRADTRDELPSPPAAAGAPRSRTPARGAATRPRMGGRVPLGARARGEMRADLARTRTTATTSSPARTRLRSGRHAGAAAGTRIPGVPHTNAYAALQFGGDDQAGTCALTPSMSARCR